MNYFIDISEFKEEVSAGQEYSDFIIGGKERHRVYFSTQKTGFGRRHYLVCLGCGSRRMKLYKYQKGFLCRCCLPNNIYKTIQNKITGGNEYIAYRMKRFAQAKGIEIKRFPFNYADYDGKPKYKHWDTWSGNLEVLQALENMRRQAHFYGKRWSTKTVNSILKRTNSLLFLFDLSEMLEYCIKWDNGVDMNTNL